MRRAKIVATLGPATSSYENIRAIIDAGVDVARMNLSHGSYDVHEGVYANVRKAADDAGHAGRRAGRPAGPEDPPRQVRGRPLRPRRRRHLHDHHRRHHRHQGASRGTTFKGLPARRQAGRLPADRRRQGPACAVARDRRHRRAPPRSIVAGPVSNNKGINLPGVAVNVPALSEKDEADLRWGLKLGADLIALSFVRNAADIDRVHEIMAEEGRKVPVIAKIEKPQAVDNLEEIIDAFDAHHGRPRRPRRRAAARGRADRAEARRRARPPHGEAGHRRDADARVDDLEPGPDPRRDLRRRQRRPRRRRRGHALAARPASASTRSSPCRPWPASSSSTEEHGLERIPPLGTKPAHPGRRDHARRRRGRRLRRGQVPLRVHRVGRLRPPHVAPAQQDPDPGVHARARRSAAAWR